MQQRRRRALQAISALALALPLVVGCADEPATSLADSQSAAVSSGAEDVAPSPTATTTPSAPGPSADASQPTGQAPTVQPGAYISLADYEADAARYQGSSTVVLFFHADWCHYCLETDADLAANGVPDALTLVQVDYDTEDALREKYGVTVQHTYVQIDADGEPLAKFAGQTTGAEILAETK